jgi:hypothetical protein
MTNLERLIQAHVEGTTVMTISQATERVAEELAREFLKDATVRAELTALVRKHFAGTVAALRTNGTSPRRRKATKRT